MSENFRPISEPVTARVVGIIRGREIDARASLELDARSLVLHWTGATSWQLPLDSIDGASTGPSRLTLYLSSGDVLEFSDGESLRAFGAQLIDRACVMPELTRGLRSFGSLRGSPGASHDAWFAPLLSARRAVEGVSDPLRQLELLDAPRLSDTMNKVISALAAIQAPTDAPTQRAIEAVLEEEAAPLFVALQRMSLTGETLRGSALDTRLADWRMWVDTVKQVFVAADEAWRKCAPVVAHTRD